MDNLGPPHDDFMARGSSASAEEVTCQQFVELITHYLEGSLPTQMLSHVEEHLVMCDWCVTYHEQMAAMIASLGRLAEASDLEPSATVLSALRANRERRR